MITSVPCYTVYKHRNAINGKMYVGVTSCSLVSRFKKGGIGYRNNKLMWEDIEKYGWDNFTHTTLASGLSADEAYEMEADLIRTLKLNNPKYGYNVYPGGYRVPSGKYNAMSKKVLCTKDGISTEYECMREASDKTGESMYHLRKSMKTGEATPKGYVVAQVI